jgi:hypothetical protein
MANNPAVLIFAFLVIILAAAVLVSTFHIPLFLAGQSSNQYGGLNTSTKYSGGTITGISTANFSSNFGPLNGPAYLVNYVINGAGQQLIGTQQQIAKGINSSVSTYTNNPININWNLLQEALQIPYSQTGDVAYNWQYISVGVNYTFTQCPFGTGCTQNNQGSAGYVFTATGAFAVPTTVVLNAISGYVNACQAKGNGAIAVKLQDYILTFPGNNGEGVQVQCIQPVQALVGKVYQAGNANLYINTSITFSNGTFTNTMYLNSAKPSTSFQNTLYAGIYAYAPSGQNIFGSEPAPTFLSTPTGGNPSAGQFIYYASPGIFSSAEGFTPYGNIGFPSSWLVTAPAITGGFSEGNLYDPRTLFNNVNTSTKSVSLLIKPLQYSDPYQGIVFPVQSGVATLDITRNPSFYPQAQLAAKVSTLAIYVPVSKPVIISVTPSKPSFVSGSSTTFAVNVQNQANASATVSVSASCGTANAQGSAFIQRSSTSPVWITMQSPQSAINTTINCNAQASSSFGINSNFYNFTASVRTPCPAGQSWNGTACQGGTTTTIPGGGGGGGQTNYLWLYVLIGIAAIAALFAFALRRR